MYGAYGEKIGVYQWAGLTEHFNNQGVFTNDTASFAALRTSLWFDGMLLSEAAQPVMTDRLGTNKATSARYYPYGEEITSTANDRVTFATYNRDGFTGAGLCGSAILSVGATEDSIVPIRIRQQQRGANNPAWSQSWNRYAYVTGDPVNLMDPHGLFAARDFHAVLARVREGAEIVIEEDHMPVAVIRTPQAPGRMLDEAIRIAEAFEARAGYAPIPDEDFARDVQEGIDANREPLNPPAWD